MIFAVNVVTTINNSIHKAFFSHDLDNKLSITKISLAKNINILVL